MYNIINLKHDLIKIDQKGNEWQYYKIKLINVNFYFFTDICHYSGIIL
jgi:hypothetical protein